MSDAHALPDDLQDRVRRHADRHPDATAAGVIGAVDGLDPSDLDAVRAPLDDGPVTKPAGFDDEDTDAVAHDTDRDRDALNDHDADATQHDETTTDIRDVLKAVGQLEPSDVHLSTTKTRVNSTGWSTWDPSYRSSESGESLHYNGDGGFHDHKKGQAFGVLGLLAAEEGIITDPWDRLKGSDWWAAVEEARDDDSQIPDHVAPTPSKAGDREAKIEIHPVEASDHVPLGFSTTGEEGGCEISTGAIAELSADQAESLGDALLECAEAVREQQPWFR